MYDSDKMERVCGYLRLIERTRLLKNTSEELEQLVGFSIYSANILSGTSMPTQRLPMILHLLLIRWKQSNCLFSYC